MNDRPHRRRFLTAVITPLAAPLGAGAADEPAGPAPAVALTALARARFGRWLDEAGVKAVQAEVKVSLRQAAALRRVRLDPADEPAVVFQADVPE